MLIFCVGMIRAGSTLQYQLVAELVEAAGIGERIGWAQNYKEIRKCKVISDHMQVYKTHAASSFIEYLYYKQLCKVCYIYRDIRDVTVSLMQKHNWSFEQCLKESALNSALEAYTCYTSLPKALVVKYENFIANPMKAIKRTIDFLEIENVSDAIVSSLLELFDIDAQKSRLRCMKRNDNLQSSGGYTFDVRSLMHVDHIRDGSVGKYKTELTAHQINVINEKYYSWLLANDYHL